MVKDPKIAEFNHKILDGILVRICNLNKYRLLATELCDECIKLKPLNIRCFSVDMFKYIGTCLG